MNKYAFGFAKFNVIPIDFNRLGTNILESSGLK